ncbi:MAG: class I SAM-dependent methyltransferase [Ruminococcus sp.]
MLCYDNKTQYYSKHKRNMNYLNRIAAAYVRGYAAENNLDLEGELISAPFSSLTDEQVRRIMASGSHNGLKMYRFKVKEDLPRVKMALGFLKGIYPENLLDVGSGIGVFLFPFMRDFPDTEVTSVDILDHRVDFLNTIKQGGISRLTALQEDICSWDVPDNSFDVITALEVLEHIPEVEKAVKNIVRLAKRYVVVSVPSKPDNNPEHIHLLTKEKLTAVFTEAGAKKLHFNGVNGHLFMTAAKG